MIADGFNLNQFRMSSSVGFSVPRLSQHPLLADGSNIGLNGAVLLTREWRNNPRWDRAAHAERQSVQGSLVAPAASPSNSGRCRCAASATPFSTPCTG